MGKHTSMRAPKLLLERGRRVSKQPKGKGALTPWLACHPSEGPRIAVKYDSTERARDINQSETTGVTPLMLACKRGARDLVGLCGQLGADLNE